MNRSLLGGDDHYDDLESAPQSQVGSRQGSHFHSMAQAMYGNDGQPLAPQKGGKDQDTESTRTTYVDQETIKENRKNKVDERQEARDVGYISNLVTGVNVGHIKAGFPFTFPHRLR